MDYIENLLSDASAIGAVLTALISFAGSFLVARYTAKSEIKKIEIAARREDKQAEDNAYLRMVEATTSFICDTYFDNSENALVRIAVARTYKTGYVADLMDELRDAVAANNRSAAQAKLSEIIANIRNPEDI